MPQNEEVLTILPQFSICRDYHRHGVYVPGFQNETVARFSTAEQKGLVHHGVFDTWSVAEVHGYCAQTSEG
jgi:hypothetical protein